jgi:hypothetical protein
VASKLAQPISRVDRDTLIAQWVADLPPSWAAKDTDRLTHGIVTWRTVQNWRAAGKVPPGIFVYFGRLNVAIRDCFVPWMIDSFLVKRQPWPGTFAVGNPGSAERKHISRIVNNKGRAAGRRPEAIKEKSGSAKLKSEI